MVVEELREKIAKLVCNACEMGGGFDGECADGSDYRKCSICGETADAIMAEIKELRLEVKAYEAASNHYRIQFETQQYRAEIAERAFSLLWNECKEKLGWDIDCTMRYAQQAEKELAERKNNEG